jgi:putative inorganic carbon (hco3(-)) transporter
MTAETPTRPSVRTRAKRPGLRAELGAQSWRENAALFVFLAYVAIAPIPYGQITQEGELTLELFAFAALALLLFDHPNAARLRGVRVPIAALLGIVALGLLQWQPLPEFIVGVLSPVSARVYADAGRTLEAFGRQAPVARISIAPLETLDTILLTLAYIALFVVGALVLRSRSRRRLFLGVLLGTAIVQILVATVMRSVAVGGGEEPMAVGRLHGAFVNPNHFAGYLQIALFTGFGVLWREVLHYRESSVTPSRRPAQRFESLFMRMTLRVVLWGVLAGGIALTASRGGMLAAAIVTVVLLSLGPSHPRVKNRQWTFAAAGTGVVGAAIGLTLLAVRQQPILRFLSSDPRDPASDLRFSLWQLSLQAWQHFALFGSGLGTFREAFRRVQPHNFNYLVEFAHSDPLQLLVTGGLIGLALGATAIFAFLAVLLRRWRTQPRREESAFILATFGAILALLIHGLMEFNLSIPAIPATLACVAGFGWAATHAEEEEGERRGIELVWESDQ